MLTEGEPHTSAGFGFCVIEKLRNASVIVHETDYCSKAASPGYSCLADNHAELASLRLLLERQAPLGVGVAFCSCKVVNEEEFVSPYHLFSTALFC